MKRKKLLRLINSKFEEFWVVSWWIAAILVGTTVAVVIQFQ